MKCKCGARAFETDTGYVCQECGYEEDGTAPLWSIQDVADSMMEYYNKPNPFYQGLAKRGKIKYLTD